MAKNVNRYEKDETIRDTAEEWRGWGRGGGAQRKRTAGTAGPQGQQKRNNNQLVLP